MTSFNPATFAERPWENWEPVVSAQMRSQWLTLLLLMDDSASHQLLHAIGEHQRGQCVSLSAAFADLDDEGQA